ncbi:caspase family protein [Candidatus Phyllobacterium onerii]|uniref:caspase family protein n=1 Tax=Candidatus Phyllobacterium onerii TaxID=3020828 RepID=UPI00232FFEBD|nr:caspase family protein [Phyllobacterium sp. IY22]
MTVHALIVGIGRYALGDWDLEGPCANAMAIARWLRSQGVKADQMKIFLALDPHSEAAADAFRADDFVFEDTGSFDAINTYWRSKMALDVEPNTTLFVYWSGHGVVGQQGERVFFYSDYSEDLTTSVFHADNFLKHLRAKKYAAFSDQIILADVCGNFTELSIASNDGGPDNQTTTRQLAYFATRPGKPAIMAGGMGVFTHSLLEVLKDKDLPLHHQHFVDEMNVRFERAEDQPYCVRYLADGRQGEIGFRDASNVFSTMAYKLLAGVDRGSDYYYPLLLRTFKHISAPQPTAQLSLRSMIDLLAGFGGDAPDQASYALVEFMMRIDRELRLQPVKAWLEEYSHGSVRKDISKQINHESSRRVILIDVEEQGEALDGFTGMVCYRDYSLVECEKPFSCKTPDWTKFGEKVGAFIGSLSGRQPNIEFEVHFVVNPVLFDFPFHQIELSNGCQIGNEMICLIHYRDRAWQFGGLAERSKQTHAMLRPRRHAMTVLPVQASPAPLPLEEGVYYAAFTLCPTDSRNPAKLNILNLLKRGAPYICWFHKPFDGELGKMGDDIRDLLTTGGMERFPDQLHFWRLSGSRTAGHMTALWDDEDFDFPIKSMKGPTDEGLEDISRRR